MAAILLLPVAAFAQEAVLAGTVTDSTGAVVPGVTVTAVHEATENKFVAVTDERGGYRIPVRVGAYQITAELSGFTTVTRTGVELLVGQAVALNLQISPSTLQESVTVTGEAPLIETTTSSLGGNIDPRQVQGIPVNGRNWIALALLAPGSRTNPSATGVDAQRPLPDRNNNEAREFQLNIDGQQVSADIGTGGQPKYSSDSIAEFQFISNRFDATMGRSTGVQVNAVTKSGGNQISGLFRGNFRHSRFNAENPVLQVIEPINNQQFSTTLGGPLVRDKVHYFVNFEYEREPTATIFNTRYPAFNVDLRETNNQKKGGGRVDYQLSPKARLMAKYSRAAIWEPIVAGNRQSHPAATGTNREYNDTTNLQPRLGFAYKLNDLTVLRGGSGLYYGDAIGADQSFATGNAQISVIEYANDGRPDFTANPTSGQPLPTYAQAVTRFCYANNNAPGCLIRALQEFVGPHQYVHLPRYGR